MASDAAGRRKIYTYDALGRTTKVTEEDAQGNLNVETTYEYDVLDRLRRIVQGVQTRTFVYDSLGRLTSETHPESGTTVYGYDDNGNLTTRIDARGVVTTNTYDALNRLVSSSYSDGTPTATYSYDQTSSSLIGLITNGKGRRTSAWTSDGIGYSWSYDTAGRVLQQVFAIDGATYPVGYSYTGSGCGCTKADLVSLTYPGGLEVKYTRDSIGRVLAIGKPNPLYNEDRYVRQVEYASQSGAISSICYGNNLRDTFEYNWAGRPSTLRLKSAGIGYPFIWWNFSYDNAGRLIGIEEDKRPNEQTVLPAAYSYTYDRRGMLTTAERQYDTGQGYWATEWSLTYSYDRYGNMLGRQNPPLNWTQTFTVDAATNRLQSYTTAWWGNPSTVTYGYDATGNT